MFVTFSIEKFFIHSFEVLLGNFDKKRSYKEDNIYIQYTPGIYQVNNYIVRSERDVIVVINTATIRTSKA